MAMTFHQLIRKNKRNSGLLLAGFSLFVCVLGGVIGYAWATWYAGAGPERAWIFALFAVAIAAAFAGASGVASYYGGASAILAMSRARRIDHDADPQLFNVVEEMALAAGLPPPKVYEINDTAPNAFAAGRDPKHAVVAVTTGLRQKLSREELQGVVAHEMAHIKHYDIRFAVLMATLVGMVVLMCDMFLYSMWWGGGRSRRSDRKGGGGAAAVVIMVIALVLAIIAPLIARILEMAFSRQREYLADAGAVELTRNPEGLVKALVKISGDPEVLEVANRATAPMYFVHPIKHFEQRASTIMDSHPPIKDRIARIKGLTA